MLYESIRYNIKIGAVDHAQSGKFGKRKTQINKKEKTKQS